jgi:Subtilase family
VKKLLALFSAVAVVVAVAPFASALNVGLARAGGQSLAQPRVDAHLLGLLDSAQSTDQLVVFVRADDVAFAEKAARASGLTVFDRFERVGTAIAIGTPAQIRDVAQTRGLLFIEADRPIEFHSDTSHTATRADFARQTILDDSGAPFDGFGSTIAIVDSGIDGTHPMFNRAGESKVVRNMKLGCGYLVACTGPKGDAVDDYFIDFTETTNDTDTISLGGHGTHVAGIAAGYDVVTADERHLRGAAPEAKLVGLSVGQFISVYGGAAGLNWVLEHGNTPCVDDAGAAYSHPVDCPPVTAVNNSYGPTRGTYDPASATVAIQQALVTKGVTVTWSAGNGDETNNGGDGSESLTNPPGQDPTGGVIMVANYNDNDSGDPDNELDSSSSRGLAGAVDTYPDLSAPGSLITSACRPYLTVCATGLDTGDPNYNSIGGTSMAAPYVAGIAAVLREANPSITPAEIELALENTAHKFVAGAPYEPDLAARNPSSTTSFDKGHGLIDVAAALGLVLGRTIPPVPVPEAVCTADGPVATDPTGDAKDFVLVGGFPVSEPGLDITRVDASENAANDVTFTVTVDDLGDANPQTSPNIAFDTYFTFNEMDLWAEASRSVDGALAFKLGQTVKTPNASARVPLADVTGSFDTVADTITVTVPAALLAEHAGKAPVDSDVLTAIETIARRSVVNQPSSQGQQADAATAGCPYTYGLGAVAGPPPPPPPPPGPYTPPASEGTVTMAAPYSWSDGPFESERTELVDSSCTRDETGPSCDRVGITVVVPSGGGTLSVDLLAQNLVDDFDLSVWKPDGTVLGTSESYGGLELVEEPVTQGGVYTVVVTAWSQNLSGYDATATLSAPTAPEPGYEPKPAEGTASVGSPYAWDGQTPTPVNPALACIPAEFFPGTGVYLGETACDVHYVQVNVPAGGGKLTVTTEATDDPDLFGYDIYIYDPNGTELVNGTTRAGNNAWTVNVSLSGVYRIGITSLATASGYHGTATIV